MYINLILGAVALVVLWLFLKKLLVRDDVLRENPAELLEKEVARRRAMEDEAARAFERLRDVGKERMRPVVAALAAMQSAMPSLDGNATTTKRKTLDWDDAGDAVIIEVRSEEEEKGGNSLAVSWRIPDLDLQKTMQGNDDTGVYILRRSDTGREEVVSSLDACMRGITLFIVDHMT